MKGLSPQEVGLPTRASDSEDSVQLMQVALRGLMDEECYRFTETLYTNEVGGNNVSVNVLQYRHGSATSLINIHNNEHVPATPDSCHHRHVTISKASMANRSHF